MSIDRTVLLRELHAGTAREAVTGEIVTSTLVRSWLDPDASVPAPRATLDAYCRQIDVRKRVSQSYRGDFKRTDPEVAADPTIIAGLAGVLLAHAATIAGTDHDDGFSLKCVNSALKALALAESVAQTPSLRAWALELLDAHTERTTR